MIIPAPRPAGLETAEVCKRARELGARRLMVETVDGRCQVIELPAGNRYDRVTRELGELEAQRVVYLDDGGRRLDELAIAAAALEVDRLAAQQISLLTMRESLGIFTSALTQQTKGLVAAITPIMEHAGMAQRASGEAMQVLQRELARAERERAELRAELEAERARWRELRDHAEGLAVALAEAVADQPEQSPLAQSAEKALELLGQVLASPSSSS